MAINTKRIKKIKEALIDTIDELSIESDNDLAYCEINAGFIAAMSHINKLELKASYARKCTIGTTDSD